MRWKQPGWTEYSILQVRITPKGDSKSTLSFHQEKLPDKEARETLIPHWKRVLSEIEGAIA
jgi:hypothetical protein